VPHYVGEYFPRCFLAGTNADSRLRRDHPRHPPPVSQGGSAPHGDGNQRCRSRGTGRPRHAAATDTGRGRHGVSGGALQQRLRVLPPNMLQGKTAVAADSRRGPVPVHRFTRAGVLERRAGVPAALPRDAAELKNYRGAPKRKRHLTIKSHSNWSRSGQDMAA